MLSAVGLFFFRPDMQAEAFGKKIYFTVGLKEMCLFIKK